MKSVLTRLQTIPTGVRHLLLTSVVNIPLALLLYGRARVQWQAVDAMYQRGDLLQTAHHWHIAEFCFGGTLVLVLSVVMLAVRLAWTGGMDRTPDAVPIDEGTLRILLGRKVRRTVGDISLAAAGCFVWAAIGDQMLLRALELSPGDGGAPGLAYIGLVALVLTPFARLMKDVRWFRAHGGAVLQLIRKPFRPAVQAG